uniref:Uncharacterized protein n=1 Tax=Sphaerodactylus townsendi TaxID=933632 RepID=A0ACB8FNA7_9SAUR
MNGIFILLHCALRMSSVVLSVLFRKFGREVLLPAAQIIQQSQLAVQSYCFYWVSALLYCAARWTLEFLTPAILPAPSFPVHPSYHPLDSFLQHNGGSYQTALWLVILQIAVAVFLRFLNEVQEAFCQSATAAKYELIQFLKSITPAHYQAYEENSLDDITHSLPLTRIPLCNRFKGTAPCTLKDIPHSIVMLKCVVATEHIIRGPGKYGLEVSATPLHWSGGTERADRQFGLL